MEIQNNEGKAKTVLGSLDVESRHHNIEIFEGSGNLFITVFSKDGKQLCKMLVENQ